METAHSLQPVQLFGGVHRRMLPFTKVDFNSVRVQCADVEERKVVVDDVEWCTKTGAVQVLFESSERQPLGKS